MSHYFISGDVEFAHVVKMVFSKSHLYRSYYFFLCDE